MQSKIAAPTFVQRILKIHQLLLFWLLRSISSSSSFEFFLHGKLHYALKLSKPINCKRPFHINKPIKEKTKSNLINQPRPEWHREQRPFRRRKSS